MFAVIRRYNTHEGSAEKITQRLRDEFIPMLGKVPGFISYDVVRAADGTLLSTSVFETRQAAEDSNRLASDWVHEHLASLIRTAPVILSGEIVLHHPANAGAAVAPPPRARIIPDRMSESRAPLS